MYPNIDAEQARMKLTNKEVADAMHMSAYTYGQKKLHGKFSAKEAQALCIILKSPFEYLFETKEEVKA